MTRSPLRAGLLALVAIIVGGGMLPTGVMAQRDFQQRQRPTPPPYYAIQNARIVTVSGQTLDRATIVVEEGVITAVGRNVDIPARARVVDGEGLTVYPGLIDGLTTLGHAQARSTGANGARAGGGGGPGRGSNADRTYSTGPEERPATTPWVNGADGLDAEDERLETWRRRGFTSAVTAPGTGFFPGQAAFINLAGFEGDDMVVKTPVALHTTMSGGPGHAGYPNSLLGVIAYFRQTFMDADHYGDAWSVYNGNPTGTERPEYDRALESIQTAVDGSTAILFEASSATEIKRALGLASEAGLNPVVYGAHQSYAAAEDLAAAGASVLLSLDFPKAARNGDPEAEPDLATLRLRERTPTSAASLSRNGVPFGFYSDGVRTPDDAMASVRLAIAAGLDRDAAIRAMTLGTAEIFGVADRLGSLDVGKIGNMVVTRGDLLAPDAEVRMVFVDGHLVEDQSVRMASAESGSDTEGESGEGSDQAGAPGERSSAAEWSGVTPMTPRGPYMESGTWFITGATIMTGTGETIEDGDIIVRGGTIAEVGRNLSAPGGAQTIDATGQWITPGIIDAHSHIAADGINEGSVNVSAMVGIEDVLDPDDVGIYRAAAGGVTSINLLHGSANPIGGKNAVLKMRWGKDAEELKFEGAAPGIKFALGENPSRTRTPARYPNSRMGVMDVIRQAFIDAEQYRADMEAWETNPVGIPPRRDLKLDALAEILDGRRMVHAHSYRADEILQLLRLAEEFGFQIATFQHVLEGYRVADEIAAHGAGASTFSDWWAYKVEAYEAIPYNAALMSERGVTVSINSDSGEEMRHLNQEAAKTMKWGGLSEHEALALITINPARQLGIDDRVGSLEAGKDADLVIFDGHPLSNLSKVTKTMIDGAVYFDIEMDKERQRQLEEEKQTLLDKQRPGQRRGGRVVSDQVAPGGAR